MFESNREIWFIVGSQNLYGEEVLKKVESDTKDITNYFNESGKISVKIVFKGVMTDSTTIRKTILNMNEDDKCIGLISWMHTFSPAKMWINGLKELKKPMLHLHTQYNKNIPWESIDMDFMNTNQSAHGDREFGFINTRMGIERKVVTGYWKDEDVIRGIDIWARAANAYADSKGMRVARFGDNMRQVAVTEGNKVDAEIQYGYTVDAFSADDLLYYVNAVKETEVKELVDEYHNDYVIDESINKSDNGKKSLTDGARIELGLRKKVISRHLLLTLKISVD